MRPLSLLFASIAALLVAPIQAQEIGGCPSHFASNYDPAATFNDGTCDYDLQQLLIDGYGLGDLLSSGVNPEELVGLFGAGGFIVDIDLNTGKVLVAWPFRQYDMNDKDDYWDDLSGGLWARELDASDFGSEIHDGRSNFKVIRETYGRRNPHAGDTYSFSGFLWSPNAFGIDDWFVPTESALLAYKNICQAKYAGDGYSLVWDTNPDTGTSNYTVYACGGNYPFGNRWIWTSEPVNLSSGWTDENVLFKMVNLGSVVSFDHGVSTRFGNLQGEVFPMGIGEIETMGTVTNCSDWSYNGSPNYAQVLGLPCSYPLFNCEMVDDHAWDEMVRGIYPAGRTIVDVGADSIRPLILNTPGEINLDGVDYTVNYFEVDSIVGLPPGLTLSLAAGDTITSDATVCMEWIGTPSIEGKYTLTVFGTYFVETLGILYAFPEFQPFQHDITITDIVYFEAANNVGCTYASASNYNPTAALDDGTCIFNDNCPGDFNGDELIGVQDILFLLGLYNTPCE